MEVTQNNQKPDFQAMWNAYEFQVSEPLTTKDVYAFFGKGGSNEFISQKMTEISGRPTNIPQRIKNQDLWNDFVKPFRELPQEKQTELKNALISFLQYNQDNQQEQALETPSKKMENFTDFYSNQYEIKADKTLNKHDILAFYLQYGKGAQKKLLELVEQFLEHPGIVDSQKKEELENKIINPINNKGVFASTEFKNILIDNLQQQKAFKEQQELSSINNQILFNKETKKLFSVNQEDKNIVLQGISVGNFKNEEKQALSLEAFNSLKAQKDKILIAQQKSYEIGQEYAFGLEKQTELYTLVGLEKNKENQSLLDVLTFKKENNEEVKMYKFDVDLFIGQHKIKYITPEMKEKGFALHKDFESFHLEHLKRMNPATGLTDRNMYAFLNLKLSEPLAEIRKDITEKYFDIPFDELKKLKKEDMIQKVYKLKKGENNDGKEFELKNEIQKIFLLSKGDMNQKAPEPYQKYLQGLDYPQEKGIWELEHIDKLLTQEEKLTPLLKGTPLENDEKCVAILDAFEQESEFILYSPSFHLGKDQIEAKQYLLNAFNYSLDKEQIRHQLLENISEQTNDLNFQLKR